MALLAPTKGHGAVFDKYSWEQTLDSVTVTIPVGENVRGKMIQCTIEPYSVDVSYKATKEKIYSGKLYQRIKCDESLWTLEGEGSTRAIRLDFSKNEGDCWWPYVIEGEPSIDVTAINPDPVGIDTLNGDLRAQVEKMMYDQQEREKGVSPDKQTDKEKILEAFKKQHPEMDFTDAVVE